MGAFVFRYVPQVEDCDKARALAGRFGLPLHLSHAVCHLGINGLCLFLTFIQVHHRQLGSTVPRRKDKISLVSVYTTHVVLEVSQVLMGHEESRIK